MPQGKVIRTYSSNDPVRNPDPATDPAAYNKLCQETPTAPDCGLPLYWPAPQQVLKTSGGHAPLQLGHALRSASRRRWRRWTRRRGGNGAVPHRTYPGVNSPWVAPGAYTVRLTADGQSQTQPITIKMDPRVKLTPEVQQIFTLTAQMEDRARNAAAAHKEARDLAAKVKARPQSAANDALLKQIEEIAPAEAPAAGGGGRGGRGGGGFGAAEPAAPPNLANIGGQMVGAVMAMQSAEMPPTAAQLQACSQQAAAYTSLMAKWAALKAKVSGAAASAQPAGK